MRAFLLICDESPPPTSRVVITAPPGVVAEGVEWSDGTATARWREDPPSTTTWDTVAAMESIVSQGGVRIEWLPALG